MTVGYSTDLKALEVKITDGNRRGTVKKGLGLGSNILIRSSRKAEQSLCLFTSHLTLRISLGDLKELI